MPFEVVRFLESDLVGLCTPEEGWAAVVLYSRAWLRVPAASLPADDRALAKLVGYSPKAWTSVKGVALRGWRLCSDGRLYHHVVAEKALEAWIERLSKRAASAKGNGSRYGRPIDTQALQNELQAALDLLAALNPQSRTLRKPSRRDPNGLAVGDQSESQSLAPGSQQTETQTLNGLSTSQEISTNLSEGGAGADVVRLRGGAC